MEQEKGGGYFPGPKGEPERMEWQRRHVVHLWGNGLLGGVAVATGATMVLLSYYVTGGILPMGWGSLIAMAGLAGGAAGWVIAWWEDKGGWPG